MPRPPKIVKKCVTCSSEFSVIASRKDTAKFCSSTCAAKAEKPKNMVRCAECGGLFHLKKSHAERNKVWGSFCGAACVATYRARASSGSGNPNYKGRVFDQDGYRIYSPPASLKLTNGKQRKVHQQVALEATGLTELPLSMHVHHKDCDILNNVASNLSFMSVSDHKWIHKQFGSAVLRAVERGEVDVAIAASWSDDPIRATILLLNNCVMQGVMYSYISKRYGPIEFGTVANLRPIRCEFENVETLSET